MTTVGVGVGVGVGRKGRGVLDEGLVVFVQPMLCVHQKLSKVLGRGRQPASGVVSSLMSSLVRGLGLMQVKASRLSVTVCKMVTGPFG